MFMNNNWKNILIKNGYTEQEIAILEPFCDEYTIAQIEKDVNEFTYNMYKYINPVFNFVANSREMIEREAAAYKVMYLYLRKKGLSDEQLKLLGEFIIVNMDIKEHFADSSLYKFIDDFIASDIKVKNGLTMNANRRSVWWELLNNEGLSNNEISSMSRVLASEDREKFTYNDRFEYALEFGNIPTEDIRLSCGAKVPAERVGYELKKKGYSTEAINRIILYSKLGYLNNSLDQEDGISFNNDEELVKLEKRMQKLLEKGFSTEDVIFITIIGMLNNDEITIKKELEESKDFREKHTAEVSSLYNITFPYNGTTTIKCEYLKYKKEKLVSMLNEFGIPETGKDAALKRSFWKKDNLSSYNNRKIMKRVILKDYYNDKSRKELDESFKNFSKGAAITIGGTGLFAGSLVALGALQSNQVYTLVSNYPEAIVIGGVVVAATAGLAAVGFATDIIGYDIGGRSR